jgi:signal peptidase II
MPDTHKRGWPLVQLRWLSLALAGLSLDLWTKKLAEMHLYQGVLKPVIPDMFGLTLAYNTGAAFSMLGDAGGWQVGFFAGIAIVVSVMILLWLARLPVHRNLEAAGLAMLLAGAVGNLHDRLALGRVRDFIVVHWQDAWYFPTFNAADILINLGVAALLLDMLFNHKADRTSP